MFVVLRRLVLLALLSGAGVAGYTYWRRRAKGIGHVPEWPPLEATITGVAAPAAQPADDTRADHTAPVADGPASTAPAGAAWVPAVEGECTIDHPIKANDNSGIYHVPGGRFYDRTRAERCYADAEDAAADGYRQAKA